MKKTLQILIAGMLFVIAGTSLLIEAKTCNGIARANCSSPCEWRNNACRHINTNRQGSTGLPLAKPGMDAAQAPKNSVIVYNPIKSTKNLGLIFYDENGAAITGLSILPSAEPNVNGKISFSNRPYIIIPGNAKFMDALYNTQNNKPIKVCDMLPLDISATSLPQSISSSTNEATTTNSKFGTFSNANAIIIYDLSLDTTTTPPAVASGSLKLNMVFDKNSPYTPITITPVASSTTTETSNTETTPFQKFTPSSEFGGANFIGKTYSDRTAKIYDPTGANSQVYTFDHVGTTNNLSAQAAQAIGFKTIGTIDVAPSADGKIPATRAPLYGIRSENRVSTSAGNSNPGWSSLNNATNATGSFFSGLGSSPF